MDAPPQRAFNAVFTLSGNAAAGVPGSELGSGAHAALTNQSQGEMPAQFLNWVRIIITITCAPEHPGVNGGNGREFNYFDYIPRDMIGRRLESCNVNWEPAGRYFAGIRNRYHNIVLFSQTWDCQFCGEISRHLYMSGMPRLMDMRRWFVYAIPICRTLGSCDRKAVALVDKIFSERFPTMAVPDGPCCEVCGFVHDLKWCSRCNMIQYCSVECQAHHWPMHKKDCRNAERERLAGN
ncbi:predicted protein [Uncinocarpus reesii 1704]|uniref:MYND-type domain-containing protein n=1 Tax=Uncinocarpus reesii (strain UAMH 1704) TaxID=336963 RepID=C4JKT5_UNCRE|nr:uncharacterized protein UREG_00631 [Uncinocarpus reesii 1704]EEP75784.1 predicted protein [Uncinocarpus reesii 1704]